MNPFLFRLDARPAKLHVTPLHACDRSWRQAWRRLAVMLLGTTLWASPALAASAANFIIAAKGRPKAEIIMAEQPAPPMAMAARELQRYVKAISGAELPVAHVPSKKPAIMLILLPAEKQALEDPREEDRYRLTIDAKSLRIEGASPRAVLFGVYDILERLGCGWCVPGEDVVPRRETLELAPLRLDTRPAFQYRMMLDFPMMSVAQTMAICDWIAKNRMNWVHECPNAHGEPKAWYERRDRIVPELTNRGLRLIVGGHTMHTWLPETHFATHPEWFAYEAGERKVRSLCLSNPDMTAELIKNMRLFLDRCPEVDVIDLWHDDGELFCHCAKCTRGVLTESVKEKLPASVPADAVQTAYVITLR